MYKLYLDDVRQPPDNSWRVARKISEACIMVWEEFPLVVSFDHDLGLDQLTGMDFAKYLCEYDMNTGFMPIGFEFFVHSANPCGAENIQSYMDCYLRNREDVKKGKENGSY